MNAILKPIRVKKTRAKKVELKALPQNNLQEVLGLAKEQNLKALFLDAFNKLSPEEFDNLTKSFNKLDAEYKNRSDQKAVDFIKVRSKLLSKLSEAISKFGNNPKAMEAYLAAANHAFKQAKKESIKDVSAEEYAVSPFHRQIIELALKKASKKEAKEIAEKGTSAIFANKKLSKSINNFIEENNEQFQDLDKEGKKYKSRLGLGRLANFGPKRAFAHWGALSIVTAPFMFITNKIVNPGESSVVKKALVSGNRFTRFLNTPGWLTESSRALGPSKVTSLLSKIGDEASGFAVNGNTYSSYDKAAKAVLQAEAKTAAAGKNLGARLMPKLARGLRATGKALFGRHLRAALLITGGAVVVSEIIDHSSKDKVVELAGKVQQKTGDWFPDYTTLA